MRSSITSRVALFFFLAAARFLALAALAFLSAANFFALVVAALPVDFFLDELAGGFEAVDGGFEPADDAAFFAGLFFGVFTLTQRYRPLDFINLPTL